MSDREDQRVLFVSAPKILAPAPRSAAHEAIAARLPPSIRLGTTSWSYPGWIGSVYGAGVLHKDLSGHGLTAYAKHPLLRAVEIDRTYYGPVPATTLRALADQVPGDFRFLVKAHEDCVFSRFSDHARYGNKRASANVRYLDADYAADACVTPFAEGLGPKGAALLFQFPQLPRRDVDEPRRFVDALHSFLRRLPRGPLYAVELRNHDLLVPAYSEALEDAGAVHCHNVWTAMPPVTTQARSITPRARRPLLIRWLLRPGDTFEQARARYSPFDRLVDEDRANRDLLAALVAQAHAHDVPALVLIDNKAEGSAPASAFRLADAIAGRCAGGG
jgi:uncharacterized protein YecE (DUF72 family)